MVTRAYLARVELIGREAEVAHVAERLRDRRLVTLVGPGGIGKTTLARAVVARCQADFGEGARFVDITRAETTAAVRESLAAQLGYASFRALLDAPGDHSVLLLVDNCEHVVEAAADAVEQLLGSCEMPTVLATSRTALELPGECLVPIGPLALPPAGTVDAPAVRLFVERARDAGTDVDAGEVVAELCRRLDGVPLAIELAAARARAMAPTEILDRLVAGLDVLDRPRRRGARRHQSLRAAIGWSYDLLADDERDLFDRLSVFSGPFTAPLAHAVAGAPDTGPAHTQDVLDRLVAASMVEADPSGPATWYRELDTLRSYARSRLDDRGERRRAEARFVAHVVEQVVGIIERGAADWSAGALADLQALYGNVAAAVRWCLAHPDDPAAADQAVVLVAALWGIVHQAHTDEVGELADQVVARWPDPGRPFHADAVATAATCRYMRGDNDGAVALASAALADADASPYAPVTLRRAIAQATRASGDATGGLTWFGDAADQARGRGLVALAVESDAARAQILADLGRVDEALALVAVARAEAAREDAPVAEVWARTIEGSIRLRVDPSAAVPALTAALATSHDLAYASGIATNLRSLALAELALGHPAAAAHRVQQLLDDLLTRGSTYELRLVFDSASAVLATATASATVQPAADLAATALSLPVVSITASVGHELFPLVATDGRVLPVRKAILLTREALTDLVTAPTSAPAPRDPGDGVFRSAGDVWEVGYGGVTTSVRATKGMADIARLLATPDREVHCLELIGAGVEQGDTGEVVDATARRAYEQRVRDLQQEVDDAEADHDTARAERARAELDALVDHLVAAMGLGGRSRRAGGAAERARSTVTQRIRASLRRIEAVHPRLARHLRSSLRTGTYCSYTPETPTPWSL